VVWVGLVSGSPHGSSWVEVFVDEGFGRAARRRATPLPRDRLRQRTGDRGYVVREIKAATPR